MKLIRLQSVPFTTNTNIKILKEEKINCRDITGLLLNNQTTYNDDKIVKELSERNIILPKTM